MSPLLDSLAELLGREPRKKAQLDETTQEVLDIHQIKREDKSRIEEIKLELAH